MNLDAHAAAAAIADRLTDGALLVVFTGAGMSRESGIPTFRGEEGVWRTYRAEDVATPEAFHADSKLFWEFNDHLRQLVTGAAPNAGHIALAELQRALAPRVEVRVITQNIDRLHEAAGSTRIIHLHGDIIRVVCPRCGFADDHFPVPCPELPPVCTCGRFLRPDVVLFGEEAFGLAETCDVMLVVGTSVNVQPAASLPFVAQEHGALVVEINPAATLLTREAQHSLRGTAAEMLPPLVAAMRAAGE
jgi:NAD-dependent deacetylase